MALSPFTADPASPIRRILVRVARSAGHLELEYDLVGDPAALRIVPDGNTGQWDAPTDGLWRHTCMEVFIAGAPGAPYLEFNFAPNGQWAAYRFSGYRSGMEPLSVDSPPRIELRPAADRVLLRAAVEIPVDLAQAGLRLGPAAVVEEAPGALAYWALRHVGARPDFHHPDSFALEI